jgi:hypothetical protein
VLLLHVLLLLLLLLQLLLLLGGPKARREVWLLKRYDAVKGGIHRFVEVAEK